MMDDLTLLTGMIDRELGLARSGEGYEPGPVAAELVENHVAPLLAEARAERDLLLWLHAEAVHEKGVAYSLVRELNSSAMRAVDEARESRDKAESSRQAWAEEAMRQSSELNDYADLLETCAESPSPEHLAKMLRRMAVGRPRGCEFVSDEGNCCEEDAGHDGPHLRWFDELRAEVLGEPVALCACPPEGAVFPAPWTPPQCAVHPGGGESDG